MIRFADNFIVLTEVYEDAIGFGEAFSRVQYTV